MHKQTIKTAVASVLAIGCITSPALATKLRIQTHFSAEQPSGKLAAQFVDDVQVMSNGSIEIEMFYSSSVVKSTETFDAAANGVLDCDMTGGGYQTGKDPAFQFVGDIMGGYNTPYEQLSWLYHGGGLAAADKLYNKYGMKLVGWWIPGQESLVSTKKLAGPADLKNWKFRSPPGLETIIFANLGASPIVIDFNEVFTSLETGVIDGADAASIANNESLGLYEIGKHTNYPGFHSMPSDHLACNLAVWEALPEHEKRILDTAMQKLALQTAMTTNLRNLEAAAYLPEKLGVTIYSWSTKDRKEFRIAAQSAWDKWATTDTAKALVKSHRTFLTKLGLI